MIGDHKGYVTRMRILNIEYRIFSALFGNFLQIEIEQRLVITGEHDETHHVLAHLVDDLAQSNERAGAFRHLYRLTAIQQIDQIT